MLTKSLKEKRDLFQKIATTSKAEGAWRRIESEIQRKGTNSKLNFKPRRRMVAKAQAAYLGWWNMLASASHSWSLLRKCPYWDKPQLVCRKRPHWDKPHRFAGTAHCWLMENPVSASHSASARATAENATSAFTPPSWAPGHWANSLPEEGRKKRKCFSLALVCNVFPTPSIGKG